MKVVYHLEGVKLLELITSSKISPRARDLLFKQFVNQLGQTNMSSNNFQDNLFLSNHHPSLKGVHMENQKQILIILEAWISEHIQNEQKN